MVDIIDAGTDFDFDELAWQHDEVGESDRPWLALNMVSSIDGGTTTTDGTSTALGGSADQLMFSALRGRADVILAGASTVRAEEYRAPRAPGAEIEVRRVARGQEAVPRLAVVSRSLDFPTDAAWLMQAIQPPVIFTVSGADASRRRHLEERAEVIGVGDDSADLKLAMRWLGERGAAYVLCEGGPSLNGHLFQADLVDELNLTMYAEIMAGPSSRIVAGPDVIPPLPLRLDRIVTAPDEILLRYLTDRR